ncbi:DUF1992 domain-containing protein [Ornithinimicrobium pratense]|uniref:DUF1992 domain-containing protein n=1 Tax=Ornithinimicrobium pratense TaxID=2593973 RepID=A0A5J6V594_9MICO|nr:DUF1992 domain-containing protein [Ornithinimicrobium pratense]QFG68356.1 DUF1992 domain-containing protein [Ornithinimicrobium pratense]
MNAEDRQGPSGGPTWGSPGARPGAPDAQEQLADQGVVQRPPSAAVTARAVQTWVDQTIAQAERQGAFDNLAGAGKPLRDVDIRNDPDWWVKSLIERERLDLSEALPGVMQLRREKTTFPESLLDLHEEAAVRERLEDFNERVLADRRRPHVGAGSPPVVGRVDVEEMIGAWRDLRAQRGASGTTPAAEAVSGDEATADAGAADRDGGKGRARRRRWWTRRRQP